MQTITVFLLITAFVALVTYALARFYMKVSSTAEDSHWVTRTGVIAFVISMLVVLSTVATLLALTFDHYAIAYIPLNVAKVFLLVQVTMAALLFVLPVTRQAALRSTEGRVITALFSVAVYLVVLAARLVLGLFKLSAKGNRHRGIEDGQARPWSYHGHEGYVERAERIRGKLF